MTSTLQPSGDPFGDETIAPAAPNGGAFMAGTASRYERYGKRALDLIVATAALVVLWPVLAAAAASLRKSVGRGVLFRQVRVGRHGRDFEMLKLRTMRHSRRVGAVPAYDGPERRRHHKSADDPRHTRVGRRLRRFSIDELPQLWHVVRGDMSLVGPRPELASVVDAHGLRGHERHRVRPGITGPWQVTRRALQVPLHECFDDDIPYVRNVTLRRDLAILRATVAAVRNGTGS